MPLTAQQLQQFAEEGYLFLPGCFAEEEVAVLRDEAEQIYATNRQEVWREKTGAPRTAFAPTPIIRPSGSWGTTRG
jgi:ectoine hydroxylase